MAFHDKKLIIFLAALVSLSEAFADPDENSLEPRTTAEEGFAVEKSVTSPSILNYAPPRKTPMSWCVTAYRRIGAKRLILLGLGSAGVGIAGYEGQVRQGIFSLVGDQAVRLIGSENDRLARITASTSDKDHPWRQQFALRTRVSKIGALLLSKDPKIQTQAYSIFLSSLDMIYTPKLLNAEEREALFNFIVRDLNTAGWGLANSPHYLPTPATLALVAIDPTKAFSALKGLVEKNSQKEIQIAAVIALGTLKQAEAVPYLHQIHQTSSDPRLRQYASLALGEQNAAEKNRVASVVGLFPREDPQNPFSSEPETPKQFLGDADKLVSEVSASVVEDLRKGPNDSQYENAIFKAGRLRIQAASPILMDQLKSFSTPYQFKEEIAEALGKIARPEDGPILLSLSRDPKFIGPDSMGDGGAKLMEALSHFSDPAISSFLLQNLDALKSDASRENVTESTIRALGRLRNPQALSQIIAMLKDPKTSPEIKDACLAALWFYNDPSTIPLVEDVFIYGEDPLPKVAASVLRKLEATPDRR